MTDHNKAVGALLALRNGELASGGKDARIFIWNTTNWQVRMRLEGHTQEVVSLAELQNGDIVSGGYRGELFVWDRSSGALKRSLSAHTKSVNSLDVLPNGDLISAGQDSLLIVWNTNSGSIKAQLNPSFVANSVYYNSVIAFSNGEVASGGDAYILRDYMGLVWINDANSGQLKRTIDAFKRYTLYDMKLLPNGNFASIGSVEPKRYDIKIWTQNGGLVNTISYAHSNIATSLAVLPNGDLVSSSWDKLVKIWDINTGQVKRIFTGHTDSVYSVAALSNGLVVSGSDDKTIRVWNWD